MCSDIFGSTLIPIFAVDRAIFSTRVVDIMKFHLTPGVIVLVKDSARQRATRPCHEVRQGDVFHLFDANGQQIGVFADVAAMVDYAEAATR